MPVVSGNPRDRARSSFLSANQWTVAFLSLNSLHAVRMREPMESQTRIYRWRVGARQRTARGRGGAGRGRAGRDADGSVHLECNCPSRPPDKRKPFLGVTLETRKIESPRKPMGEHNGWVTTALSTACPRDDGRSSFLVIDQRADAQLYVQTLFMPVVSGNPRDRARSSFLSANQWTVAFLSFLNSLHAMRMRERMESQTRIYRWRVGARQRTARGRGGAWRGRAGRDADGSVHLECN